MKQGIIKIATSLILASTSMFSFAQNPGDHDTDFGVSGYEVSDMVANTGEVYLNMITLANDKIVMVGYTDDDNQDILVARFLADGGPDPDFANNGVLQIDASIGANDEAFGVTELADGKLLITGIMVGSKSWDGFLMRIEENGDIDLGFGTTTPGRTNFNAGDQLTAYGKEIIVLEDNSILVGGSASFSGQMDMCVFKFTQGGGLDESFASSGVAILEIGIENEELTCMDLTENGLIMLGGTSVFEGVQQGIVAQLSSFGTPTSFAGTGYYSFELNEGTNEVNDLFVDENDKIVAAGATGIAPNIDGLIFRLNNDGSLDETFSSDGFQYSDPGATTALRFMKVFPYGTDGIMACGFNNGNLKEAYAFLMQANGSPDGDFGGNGDAAVGFAIAINTISAPGAAIQSDGSVLIGGHITSQDFIGNNLFIVRFHGTEGDPDNISSENQSSYVIYPNPTSDQFRIRGDEQIQLVELYSMNGQLLGSWSLQNQYDLPETVSNGIYALSISTNKGKVSSTILVNR